MGPDSVINKFMELAPQLDVELIIPDKIHSLCCGMPFASKGFDNAHSLINENTIDELYSLSKGGQIPILMDMSPCSYHIQNIKYDKKNTLQFVDIIKFFHEKIENLNPYHDPNKEVVIHHTCSGQKMQLEIMMEEVVRSLAGNVVTPHVNGCCGSAGDRGLFFPELTNSASDNCANSYPEFSNKAVGVSSSKMCEISISKSTEVPFQSIIEFIHHSIFNKNEN